MPHHIRSMIQTLTISSSDYGMMLQHLDNVYPLEGCGIMAGYNGRVQRLYAIENMLHNPVVYEMEPYQQMRAMLDLEEAGMEMLAIYHSHPTGPQTPSPTDVAQAYYPDAVQVIVSLADRRQPSARAFMIRDGHIHEIALKIV